MQYIFVYDCFYIWCLGECVFGCVLLMHPATNSIHNTITGYRTVPDDIYIYTTLATNTTLLEIYDKYSAIPLNSISGHSIPYL
jgi:hypothetical protein